MIQIKNCLTEYIDRICEIDRDSSSYNWTREQLSAELHVAEDWKIRR